MECIKSKLIPIHSELGRKMAMTIYKRIINELFYIKFALKGKKSRTGGQSRCSFIILSLKGLSDHVSFQEDLHTRIF